MDYQQKNKLILNGKMFSVIMTLAIPLMLNNLAQTLFNLTNTFWASRLGDTEVAAISFVWPVVFFIISIGIGMNIAGTALISQYVGSNQGDEANKVAAQLFIFLAFLSVLLSILGYLAAPYVVRFMGAEGDLLKYSTQYLKVMFLDIPMMFVFYTYNSIKQAQGDTVSTMLLNLASICLNIVLSPVLIFIFKFGVIGAALATITSKIALSPFVFKMLFKPKSGVRITFENLKLNKAILWNIVKVGLPSSIGQSASAFGFIILNTFVVSFGNNTMTAFAIGNQINSLVLMPVMGIGSALASIVGQNLGAGQISRAKDAFKTSIKISLSILTIGGIILAFLSRDVIEIFTAEPDIVSQGTEYLVLIALTIPVLGIFQSLVGVFQGSGHTVFAMFMDIGRLWLLRIPMIILFKNFTNLGSVGVWYSMATSNIIICIPGFFIYLRGKWQEQIIKKKVVTA